MGEIDTEFLVLEKKLPSLINTNQKEKYYNIKQLLIIQWLLLKNENLLKKSVMTKKKAKDTEIQQDQNVKTTEDMEDGKAAEIQKKTKKKGKDNESKLKEEE